MASATLQIAGFFIYSICVSAVLFRAQQEAHVDRIGVWDWAALAASISLLGALALIVRGLRVEFGSPEMSCGFNVMSVLAGFVSFGLLLLQTPEVVGETGAALGDLFATPINMTLVLTVRGPFWILLGVAFISSAPVYIPERRYGELVSSIFVGLVFLLISRLRYVFDQRLMVLLSIIAMNCMYAPTMERTSCLVTIAFTLLFGYLTALFHQRRRVLPAALSNCRYVRLGFLRHMQANNIRLKRLQEMPPEAFGDHTKASVLLITSHRWLHRFTCDVVSDDHSNGVRMASMLERVSLTFPSGVRGICSGGCSGWWTRLVNGLCCSGSDVLLFFDFMGLPQIGLDAEGGQLDRSDAEKELFFSVLPHMGALYTMYPVLVIPEVSDGVHPYFSSGWCYSEFCSALLSQKLSMYSNEAIAEYARWLQEQGGEADLRDGEQAQPDGTSSRALLTRISGVDSLDQDSTKTFLSIFDKELEKKRFFNNDDRSTVSGIVTGFLLKRQLMDAVAAGSLDKVSQRIDDLRDRELLHTLDHPLDDSLDTLLHRAVQLNNEQIALALLKAGADHQVKNLRGDLAEEWFMWRRCNRAAAAVRGFRARIASGQEPLVSRDQPK